MKRLAHWLTEPRRLPWIVLAMMAAFVVSTIVSALLYVQQSQISNRQALAEAQAAATRAAVCESLRTDVGEPGDPAPSTPYGRVRLDRALDRYTQLGCTPQLTAGR